jgi:serine/threonine protein kinase
LTLPNLLLDADLRLKIADFESSSIDGGLCEGSAAGRFSPPQVDDENGMPIYGMREEIFTLGCTMYTILSGQIPFPDIEDDDDIDALWSSGQYPDTSKLLWGDMVRKCWTGEVKSVSELMYLTHQSLLDIAKDRFAHQSIALLEESGTIVRPESPKLVPAKNPAVKTAKPESEALTRSVELPQESVESGSKELDQSTAVRVETLQPAPEEFAGPDELLMKTPDPKPEKLNRSESLLVKTLVDTRDQTGLGEQLNASETLSQHVSPGTQQDISDTTSASAEAQVREKDVATSSIKAEQEDRLEPGMTYRNKFLRLVMLKRKAVCQHDLN